MYHNEIWQYKMQHPLIHGTLGCVVYELFYHVGSIRLLNSIDQNNRDVVTEKTSNGKLEDFVNVLLHIIALHSHSSPHIRLSSRYASFT